MFKSTSVFIPCCICGVPIKPNPNNMCADCLAQNSDIGASLNTSYSLNYCKTCGRYQCSPTTWAKYQLESHDLLQMCIKKISVAKGMRIVDAKFVWTEPHSKRIKLNVTFENETFEGTVMRKTVLIVFTVVNVQCPDCCELATPRDHWKAIVQVRQHVEHKRTIFWLEQQIISHHAQNGAIAIERKSDGLDFQFNDKTNAEKFVNFLKNYLPIDVKGSKKIAGQDLQCNTYDLRFSYSVKCPTISRQDLVLLPKNLVNISGGRSKLGICFKYGKKISLIDPFNGNIIKVDSKFYWTKPFDPLMCYKELKRFVVLGKEIKEEINDKISIAEFELTDEETYGERFLVNSHLGNKLEIGDVCLCYDLRDSIFPDDISRALEQIDYSGIIVVSKTSSSLRNKKRNRKWRLKELTPHREDDDQEFESFMDTLEFDTELRNGVTFLKNEKEADDNIQDDTDEIEGEMKIITEEEFYKNNVPFVN